MENSDSDTLLQDKKRFIKNIINSTKYLKKVIKRLPKETLTEKEKQKLFHPYEEVVEAIVDHCR
jgi:SPX domain protein involved in polyphosphate accumulation